LANSGRLDLQRVRAALAPEPPALARVEVPEQWAAVAAVLHEDQKADLHVLLIRRASHPRDPWSGHMALPGGRMVAEDRSLVETAIRETAEELGFDLGRHAELIGRLDAVQAVARGERVDMLIVPFVFAVKERPELLRNEEVEEALWVPLNALRSGELSTHTSYEHRGVQLKLPAFDFGGRIIWGLTHQMLTRLLTLVNG
jgi:8-oxo-dGTP pyrophosphatase MutT (NUDIX family)